MKTGSIAQLLFLLYAGASFSLGGELSSESAAVTNVLEKFHNALSHAQAIRPFVVNTKSQAAIAAGYQRPGDKVLARFSPDDEGWELSGSKGKFHHVTQYSATIRRETARV